MGFGVIGALTPEDFRMKIALSASFFTCPPVAAKLLACDIVYTTNDNALKNFAHKDIRPMTAKPPGNPPEGIEVIDFVDLVRIFNAWVYDVATDEELVEWADYFKETDPAEMRKKVMPRERLIMPLT